jgi:UDP-glucose 4-epimerase
VSLPFAATPSCGSIPPVREGLNRVVVTGGAGFIGSHVADAFLERGARVLVIDDLSTGRDTNVPRAAELEQIDIVDAASVATSVRSFVPDLVCHLAAQASVTASVARPEHDLAVNVRGTLNVLEAAREAGASLVFASTGGALYGDAPLPTPEDSPTQPLAPYGASKLAAEAYVTTWSRLHGLANVVLRLGNVYGPRQAPHGEAGVVAIFSAKLVAGETPTIFGDGEQTRDYVYVGDVADAFVRAAESGRAATYNVGTGRETSVNELLEILQRVARTSIEAEFAPPRPGELLRSALDASLIAAELDWRATLELHDGLAATFATYR